MSGFVGLPPFWLCWCCGLGGLSGYFWAHNDPVAALVIGLIGITGLAGYWLRPAVIVAFMVAAAASSLFAGHLAEVFGPTVADSLGTSGAANRILAASVGFVAIGFVAMLVVEIIWNRFMGKRETIRPLARTVGLWLGAVQGALLALLILGGVLVTQTSARFAAARKVETVSDMVQHWAADSVVKIGRASDDSAVGPFVKKYNPFDRLPQLRRLHTQRTNLQRLTEMLRQDAAAT